MQSSAPARTEHPKTFLIVLVVVAVIIAGVVGYLGLTGKIGGGIPGSKSGNGAAPAVCEGGTADRAYTFSFVAQATGANGGLNFNGTSPGPCAEVGLGSNVTVKFSVSANADMNHSWVLIPANGNESSLPVFPGAGFANATRMSGLPAGASAVFHFTASKVGSYRYICEMPGHFAGGMWGWFNVTTATGSSEVPAASSGSSASGGVGLSALARN